MVTAPSAGPRPHQLRETTHLGGRCINIEGGPDAAQCRYERRCHNRPLRANDIQEGLDHGLWPWLNPADALQGSVDDDRVPSTQTKRQQVRSESVLVNALSWLGHRLVPYWRETASPYSKGGSYL